MRRKGFVPFLIIGFAIVGVTVLSAFTYFKVTYGYWPFLEEKQKVAQPLPINKAESGPKFLYYESEVIRPTTNIITDIGEYKNRFIIFDVSTGTKKVIYEESWIQDMRDAYRLFQNKILITAWDGNRAIDLNGQKVTNLPKYYFSGDFSPSGKIHIGCERETNIFTFSISDNRKNLKKEIKWIDEQKDWLFPHILGWSSDENYAFFVAKDMDSTSKSLYVLDLVKEKVEEFPRDNSILDTQATFVDNVRDKIYFVAKNGFFVQPRNSLKATPIKLKSFDLSTISDEGIKIISIVFPTDYDNHSIAISNGKRLIVKDLVSGEENLVFEDLDGLVRPMSWKGDNLIYFCDGKDYVLTRPSGGYFYIVGNIYNSKTKKSIEFVNQKSDYYGKVGTAGFIGWL
ncbi:MAG: hypothetical protein A2Z24_01350 [Candidatus Woykebacteria bacterium RBG_16_44_10]|uniref:Uncharacterized protein n=1 Tax=Candidatus Woykebacteria bacterium RBG_16_44_10 TaxID=1802597 RepID=A0A1G1WG30_9BACT|nr:MAG: hypothetical protein A2Z24_01350 [Candidatus Woykebacteria bacterium RBG_16_44_10]